MNHKLLSLAPLLLALAACGGGSDNAVAADPLEVPASAGQSSTGFVSYLAGLPAQAAEMREPVSVDAFVPPQSDTVEPIPVGG